MIKFWTRNNNFPLNKNRFSENFDDKKCHLCEKNDIGDEFHYLFNCSFFKKDRNHLIPENFRVRPSTLKMKNLFMAKTDEIKVNLKKFVSILVKKFEK